MIKRGSKVRIVKMDTAGGMDWQAKRLEGKVFTVRFIDPAGQIHLEETGLALIPGVDQYDVVKMERKGPAHRWRRSSFNTAFCQMVNPLWN